MTSPRARGARPSRLLTWFATVAAAIFAVGAAVAAAARIGSLTAGWGELAFSVATPGFPGSGVAGSEATSVGIARITELVVPAAQLSFWPVFWSATATVLWALVAIAPAVLVIFFADSVTRGEPFGGRLAGGLTAVAVIVLVAGSAAVAIDHWSLATARAELVDRVPLLTGGQPGGDIWPPIAAAAALGVLAAAFRIGARLRRDAEGLV